MFCEDYPMMTQNYGYVAYEPSRSWVRACPPPELRRLTLEAAGNNRSLNTLLRSENCSPSGYLLTTNDNLK